MTVERSEFEQIHNDGIEHICHALMSSGLWQEIDGDGTEYTVIADRIVELILYLTEAIDLLRHPNEHDVGAFLSDLPAALSGRSAIVASGTEGDADGR